MKEPNIKILVACHKADPYIRQDDIYMPIQVGKALHPEINLGFQCDNEGDNISHKNDTYCELTALYWAWKNLKGVDYIGLCHYRRYFDFKTKTIKDKIIKGKEEYIKNSDYKIIKQHIKNNIIKPKPILFPYNLRTQYSNCHNSFDLNILNDIIKADFPYIEASFKKIFNSNKLSPYNMFIMDWQTFVNFCEFIFSILPKLEKKVKIKDYDLYQRRIFGFLSERLLNVFLDHISESKKITEFPIKLIDSSKKNVDIKNYISRNFRKKLAFFLTKNLNTQIQ